MTVFRRFSTKLSVAFLIAAVLPLAVLAYVNYITTRDSLLGAADRQLVTNAVGAADAIDSYLTHELGTVAASAGLGELPRHFRPGGEPVGVDRLRELKTLGKEFQSVALLDLSGKVMASSESSEVGTDLKFRDYFKEAAAGKTFVSDPTISVITNKFAIFYSAPVKDSQGAVVGVLRARAGLEELSRFVNLDSGALGPGSSGELVDQYLIRLVSPAHNELLTTPLVPLSSSDREALIAEKRLGNDTPTLLDRTTQFDAQANALRQMGQTSVFSAPGPAGVVFRSGAARLKLRPWVYQVRVPLATVTAGASATLQRSRLLAVLLAIAVILGATIYARMTVRPLRALQGLMAAAATGDLRVKASRQSADEFGDLADAFNQMVGSLRDVAGELKEGVGNISSATAEILAATSEQSAGAAQQAAAISQTTATVDEVKASAEAVAETAQVVAEAARQASSVANEGAASVERTVAGMAEIREKVESIAGNILALSEQTQQIGEIIASVNELAGQSNLLALNAAIEASRAGEQGKGFAVVAGEVRTLAEQSKAATGQVRSILGEIQRATNAAVLSTEEGSKGVDVGVSLIDRAGQTIEDLVEAIERTSGQGQQIAVAVRQHAIGMEQVAQAMVNIQQATSQSLGAANSTRAAAEQLTALAERLRQASLRYQT